MEQQPDDRFAQEMLHEVSRRLESLAAAAGRRGREPQYLLIKAWGFGFWSDVDHVLGSLLLAEITGRIPIVHWGANSLFSDDPTSNAWQSFFEPISNSTIEMIARDELSFFPPKWSSQNLRQAALNQNEGPWSRMAAIYLLHRPEVVAVADFHVAVYGLLPYIPPDHAYHGLSAQQVYRALVDKYLKPKASILEEVETFYERHLAGAPVLAVHYRGSDKFREDKRIDQTNAQYFEHLDAAVQEPGWRIFLLTDTAQAVQTFGERYGDRVVVTDCERSSDQVGVHKKAGGHREQRGVQVMRDAYRQRDVFGPYVRVPCAARWVLDQLPEVHRLRIPEAAVRAVYAEPVADPV